MSTNHTLLSVFRRIADGMWESRLFLPGVVCLAAIAAFLSPTAGAMGMALLCCFLLIFCGDILAAFPPFLMICLITLDYYDNYGELISYWWAVCIVILCLIFHLIRYRRPLRAGPYFSSAVLVSIAALTAGVGKVSVSKLLRPVSLYYTLGLGLGMLAVYLVGKTYVRRDGDHEPAERFAHILYCAGIMAGVMVVRLYCQDLPGFLRDFTSRFFSYRNYVSTVMLMSLPIPFYLARKNLAHLFGALFINFCLFLAGSRSGALIGTLLMVVGIGYLLWYRRKQKKFVIAALLLLVPFALSDWFLFQKLFASRMADGTLYIEEGDSRIVFFLQSLKDFISNPLFGTGLMNDKNGIIFTCVPGSMVWYHNYVAQVMGSMGLMGIIAYLWQMWQRFRIVQKTWEPLGIILGASYCGILMMSMVNPGEFCPLPNELLVTTLFALLEDRGGWPERTLRKKERL